MSSVNRNSARTQGKKKFGKNLNKVTKAPAPPNPSSANARGATSSSRNGLLLLSTKRASTSSSTGGTAAASGGLLSSKAPSSPSKKPMQPLGLTTESYSSAHDALLGAVIGASRMADTQQPPDAWGTADKQTSSAPEPALAPKGGISSGVSSYNPAEESAKQETDTTDMARERAEQRRTEEEMRFYEQKERAAERLRELEEKMAAEKPQVPVPVALKQRPAESSDLPTGIQAQSNVEENNGVTTDNAVPLERPRTRTLYDPNRPYSALVGGKSESLNGDDGAKVERRGSPTMVDEYSRNAGVSQPRNGAANGEEQPSQPVIHISNYETRDRGERNTNAGPRMLFDPKSGSMVAAPSRDEGAGRGKKGKVKGRKERRDSLEGDDNGASTGKLKRNKNRKQDDRRKRVDDNDVKNDSKKRAGKPRPSENRLPRTCGVLYKRDEQGNCICADECDGGDQGFGAHCVPGGRVRNEIEYSKFVAQQKAYEHEGDNGLAYGVAVYGEDHPYYAAQEASYEPAVEEPEMVQKEIDWVKPDEKIELVTGLNDSPTLQATASTWVPSQAALAAAAAAREEVGSDSAPVVPTMDSENAEESNDDDDNPVSGGAVFLVHSFVTWFIAHLDSAQQQSFVGLGFDPTKNMDSVIQSPSVKATRTRNLDPMELAGLSLEGAKGGEATSRNLFAFGSSPWGGGSGADSTDWAALTGSSNAQGVNNEGQDKAAGAASFLSLSSGNPWGSSGLSSSGFGGAAMPGSSSSGQGATGD